MISVVLVDDEPLIVRGVEKIINWKEFDAKIIGTANSGLEALHLIRAKNPDIVISDINMPDLSGIDLLKILKKEQSKTKVIFISGYQEFEYARDALKYGAEDYLVKPINKNQLIYAINKIINSKQLSEFENDIFHEGEEINFHGYYMFFNCIHDNEYEFSENDREIIHFSTFNILEELTNDYKGRWVIRKNNNIYILFYNKDKAELQNIRNKLALKLIENVKNITSQSLTIGVSDIVEDLNSVKIAYNMSNEAIKMKYFYPKGSVIYYKKSKVSKYTIEKLYSIQENIAKLILAYDEKKFYKNIDYFLEVAKEVSLWDIKNIINYCLSAIIFVKKQIKNNGIEIEDNDFDNFNKLLYEQKNFYSLKKVVIEYFKKMYGKVMDFIQIKENKEIIEIKKYIEENYRENIMLDTIASLFYMNPNYFSCYFKKQTGVNFKEYLTNIRMKEAEKLLLTTNKKIYEIAEYVGFNDYRHFSEVFKRKYGKLPSEYKSKFLKMNQGEFK